MCHLLKFVNRSHIGFAPCHKNKSCKVLGPNFSLYVLKIVFYCRCKRLMPHIQRNSFTVCLVEGRGSQERWREEEGWKTICVTMALQAWMSQGVRMTIGRREGSCSVSRTMTFVSLLIQRGHQGLLTPEHLQSTQQNTVISDARTWANQSSGC